MHESAESTVAAREADGDGPLVSPGRTIPGGWTVAGWISRLEQLAAACEGNQPQRAAELRAQAAALRRRSARDPAD